MEFLSKLFGMQPYYFYLSSYIFRILAAFTLLPLLLLLTKNKVATYLGVFFFSITTIGLQTTEYLPHITSYISLAFFHLFLYFFILARQRGNIKYLLFFSLFFYLTFVFAPVRMTGLIPFILSLELFWLLQDRSKETFKQALKRLGSILLIFYIIITTGHPFFYLYKQSQSFNIDNNPISENTLSGLNSMINFLISGRFDFLFYPLISFGNMFLPDSLTSNLSGYMNELPIMLQFIIIYYFFIVFILLLRRNNSNLHYLSIAIFAAFWTLLSFAIFMGSITTFPAHGQFINLLIGGYVLIITICLLQKYFKDRIISTALFTSISWAFLSFLGPWLWAPSTTFPTNQRYLIVSASGISLLLATLVSVSKRKLFIIIIVLVLTILHSIISSSYLNNILSRHSQNISQEVWSSMPFIAEVKKDSTPLLFYFKGDDTNGTIIDDVISYGFPPHMDILYGLNHPEDKNMPVAVSDWKIIISAVTDGNSLVAFGYPKKPFLVDQIYAFQLVGKDHLINITTSIRSQLTKEVKPR